MSLTDCVECWDTPCTCGHEGYIVLYLPKDHGLSSHDVQALKEALKSDLMDRLCEIKENKPRG